MSHPIFRIDLHVHSNLGVDSEADPEECVLRAIELRLQGLAFTEHYSYAASDPIDRLAERYRDRILVLRGVEFSALEGHCLVFGADPDRLCESYAPAEELIRRVNRAGGVVVPSHPYRRGSGVGDLMLTLGGIAAVEGHNGANLVRDNELAIKAAGRRRLPVTGGSDAHLPGHVGSCYTVFREAVTAGNLVELLRGGRFEAVDTRKVSRGLPGVGGGPPAFA